MIQMTLQDILTTCKKLEREMDSLCQAILNTRPAERALFETEA